MTATVPASTSIRRNRVRNVDTDRLLRRRAFIIPGLNGSDIDRRIDFVMRAAELHAIENTLADRGVVFARVSTRQP